MIDVGQVLRPCSHPFQHDQIIQSHDRNFDTIHVCQDALRVAGLERQTCTRQHVDSHGFVPKLHNPVR